MSEKDEPVEEVEEVEHTHIIVDHDDDFMFRVTSRSAEIDWGEVLEILIRAERKEKP